MKSQESVVYIFLFYSYPGVSFNIYQFLYEQGYLNPVFVNVSGLKLIGFKAT